MNQGVTMLGFVAGGVLIYSAVTDNSIWDTITGQGKKGRGNIDSGGFTSGTGGGGVNSAATGSMAEVAQAALKALRQKQNYEYDEIRPIPGSLFGPPPIRIDCSGFYTLCSKWAGLPDPNGNGYDGSGNTSTLIAHMRRVRSPVPGAAVFYGGTAGYPQHVAVYVGGGKVVSMGAPGDPSLDPTDLGIQPIWGFYVSNLAGSPLKGFVPHGPGRLATG